MRLNRLCIFTFEIADVSERLTLGRGEAHGKELVIVRDAKIKPIAAIGGCIDLGKTEQCIVEPVGGRK